MRERQPRQGRQEHEEEDEPTRRDDELAKRRERATSRPREHGNNRDRQPERAQRPSTRPGRGVEPTRARARVLGEVTDVPDDHEELESDHRRADPRERDFARLGVVDEEQRQGEKGPGSCPQGGPTSLREQNAPTEFQRS